MIVTGVDAAAVAGLPAAAASNACSVLAAGRDRRRGHRRAWSAGLDRLDALVNCAGILARHKEYELPTFQKVLDVNLTGSFRLCLCLQAAAGRPTANARWCHRQHRVDERHRRPALDPGLLREQGWCGDADQDRWPWPGRPTASASTRWRRAMWKPPSTPKAGRMPPSTPASPQRIPLGPLGPAGRHRTGCRVPVFTGRALRQRHRAWPSTAASWPAEA